MYTVYIEQRTSGEKARDTRRRREAGRKMVETKRAIFARNSKRAKKAWRTRHAT